MKKQLIVLLALLTCSFGWAQSSDGTQAVAPTYRLQIEDVLQIRVYNENQANAEVQIGRDGNITAPFVGIVRAVGKTTTELEQDLAREYQRRLRIKEPKVAVVLMRVRPVIVSITGQVFRPGPLTIRPTDSVLNAIAAAGGVQTNGSADLRRAYMRRAGEAERIPLDLYAMFTGGDASQNYPLRDGDEIHVPLDTSSRLLILGAVNTPGTYQYSEGFTVIDALSLARMEIPNRSMLSKTTVLREKLGSPGEYMSIQVNMVAFLKKQDPSQNIRLLPGDIVYVPNTRTPDLNQVSSILNSVFILNNLGLLGDVFRRR